jgi:hypothetical protein
MSGTRTATQGFRERALLDKDGSINLVHFPFSGPEKQVNPGRATGFFIGCFGSGVTTQIRAGLELQWIDENGYDHFAL